MRYRPFFATFLQTLSHFRFRPAPPRVGLSAFRNPPPLRSMSGIPILGALFGSSASKSSDMSYPDKRSNDEWRAVLNKGM